MRTVLFFLLIILSVVNTAGWAHEPPSPELPIPPVRETADDLLKACAASSLTPRGRLRLRYCYGYLTGVEETMRVMMEGKAALCPPSGTTPRELARTYVVYATTHKNLLTLPAVTVAARALQDRYPCKPHGTSE